MSNMSFKHRLCRNTLQDLVDILCEESRFDSLTPHRMKIYCHSLPEELRTFSPIIAFQRI